MEEKKLTQSINKLVLVIVITLCILSGVWFLPYAFSSYYNDIELYKSGYSSKVNIIYYVRMVIQSVAPVIAVILVEKVIHAKDRVSLKQAFGSFSVKQHKGWSISWTIFLVSALLFLLTIWSAVQLNRDLLVKFDIGSFSLNFLLIYLINCVLSFISGMVYYGYLGRILADQSPVRKAAIAALVVSITRIPHGILLVNKMMDEGFSFSTELKLVVLSFLALVLAPFIIMYAVTKAKSTSAVLIAAYPVVFIISDLLAFMGIKSYFIPLFY